MNRTNPQISLIVLAVFFLVGAIVGCIMAVVVVDPTEITDFFSMFWDSAQTVTLQNSFVGVLIGNLLLPTIIFVLGFCVLGAIAIPVCVGVKGFTITFAVTAIMRAFGTKGVWLALSSIGISSLLYIPCLLLVALFAFRASLLLTAACLGSGSKQPLYGAPYFVQFAMCLLVFTAVSAFNTYLQPALLSWVSLLV